MEHQASSPGIQRWGRLGPELPEARPWADRTIDQVGIRTSLAPLALDYLLKRSQHIRMINLLEAALRRKAVMQGVH